jgi:large subunit ribosomal protein L22
MPVVAKLNYLRIAPRKVRLVADLIRGKSVGEAQAILSFTIKKGSSPLLKLLSSAAASARNNFQLEESNLYVSKIKVDEGPKYKRFFPRARGQAYEIQKKTSSITLVLDMIEKRKLQRLRQTAKVKEPEKAAESEKVSKTEKPKLRPKAEVLKPKAGKGIKRIFRRKSF